MPDQPQYYYRNAEPDLDGWHWCTYTCPRCNGAHTCVEDFIAWSAIQGLPVVHPECLTKDERARRNTLIYKARTALHQTYEKIGKYTGVTRERARQIVGKCA